MSMDSPNRLYITFVIEADPNQAHKFIEQLAPDIQAPTPVPFSKLDGEDIKGYKFIFSDSAQNAALLKALTALNLTDTPTHSFEGSYNEKSDARYIMLYNA